VFTTTGEVHHGGIQNELDVIDVLNEANIYPTPVTHAGGTQNKADAYAGEVGISIKRKRDLNNGSYDYLNSTVPVSTLPYIDLIDVWKEETLALAPTQENKEIAKQAFNVVSSFVLSTIDSNTLTAIVSDTFQAQAGMDIAITDQQTESLYLFSADDMEVPQLLKAGYKAQIVQTKNIVTSRKIVFVKDGDIRDVGLRIRLVTNNGVGAMMGMSKANKTSSVVVKIQQDKVGRMVHNTPHKVIAM
jgi:hypothetical protein